MRSDRSEGQHSFPAAFGSSTNADSCKRLTLRHAYLRSSTTSLQFHIRGVSVLHCITHKSYVKYPLFILQIWGSFSLPCLIIGYVLRHLIKSSQYHNLASIPLCGIVLYVK